MMEIQYISGVFVTLQEIKITEAVGRDKEREDGGKGRGRYRGVEGGRFTSS
jgi:hypothetical protein